MKRRVSLLLCALAALAACAQLTPQQAAVAQALVTVVGDLVPGGSAALGVGQLLCQGGGGLVAVYDAATGKPFLVTGRSATLVANVCSAIGGSPTAPPAASTTVTAKAVAIPAS